MPPTPELIKNVLGSERASQAEDGSIRVTSKYTWHGWDGFPLDQETAAYTILTSGALPQWGLPHDKIPNLVVLTKTCVPIDKGTFEITIVWGVPTADDTGTPTPETSDVVSGGASLASVQTERDIQGRPILVEHTFVGLNQLTGESVTKTQVASIASQAPLCNIRRRKREVVIGGAQVLVARSAKFTGSVNKFSWPNGVSHPWNAPETWMCTGIEFDWIERAPDPLTFDVVYEFQRAPSLTLEAEGVGVIDYNYLTSTSDRLARAEAPIAQNIWQAFAVYIDEATGQPPSPLPPESGGTGSEPIPTVVQRYPLREWHRPPPDGLGLS